MAYPYIPAKSISYGGTRALNDVKYIVIHYTANDDDTALANCNYFKNSNTRSAGAHWFVDRSGAVYQSIDMKRIAWSVGGFFTQSNGAGSYYKKCTNTNSVSIEMCDVKSQYPSGAQIAAIKKLITHIQSECKNAKTIIRHWDVNGKSCPARMAGKNNSEWDKFYKEITGKQSTSSGSSTPSTKKGYTGTFPALPNRGYYQTGDGYRTLTNYTTQIKRVQQFLNWAVGSGLTVDGDYGPKTAAACIAFQKKAGISADGKFGKNTLAKAKAFKK